jgi:ribosomal-protein-alanine N-acetyltransferase
MPRLELVRADHAEALLAFERENREYFAASIPDRGDDYFAEFAARHARLLKMQAAGTDFFHLLVTDEGRIAGRVNLVEAAGGSAELGYRIAKDHAGRGVATAAVGEVRVLAASRYGLSRLRAKVTLDNPASHRILERNGFVAVGEMVLNGKPAVTYLCELGQSV